MDTEIELKLFVTGNVQAFINESLLSMVDAEPRISEFSLFNQYYDTPDKVLRQHDIGLRVRSKNDHIEQTVKTAGKVVGGLHQRPEYNVTLDSHQLDLDLFDASIWPDDMSLSRVEAQLEPLFSTDFTRKEYLLTFKDGDQVELVFDEGEIRAGNHSTPICEIELELKKGQPGKLFDVADKIARSLSSQVANQSKAARGYMLNSGSQLFAQKLPEFLNVARKDTLEDGFVKAAEVALAHWQHHQTCYLQSMKINDLAGVLEAVRLLSQAVLLYQSSLACEQMTQLQSQLKSLLSQWHWLDNLLAIKGLRSKRGPYCKKLLKQDELMSYLFGLSEGMLQRHKPQDMLLESDTSATQLLVSRMILEKTWRQAGSVWQGRLSENSSQWLTAGWQHVMSKMSQHSVMHAQDYI